MTDTTEKPAEAPQTLLTALLAVQAEIPSLTLGKTGEGQIAGNKNYKYLTLNYLMAEVLPLLSKNNLVWVTRPEVGDDGPILQYELIFAPAWHIEGPYHSMRGTFPLMLDKANSQGLGSAITYARRYALTAVLGLTPDDDDDGAAASKTEKTKKAEMMDAAGIKILRQKIEEKEAELPLLLAAVGAENINDLTKEQGEKAWRLLDE
jgi:hypothetical protein